MPVSGIMTGEDRTTCQTCGANIPADGHWECAHHAPCMASFIFSPKECEVCREAATWILHKPGDKTSPDFILLRSQWRNLQKLASSSGQPASWVDLALVVYLGLARWISPLPSLSRLLDDRQMTRQVFAGFSPSRHRSLPSSTSGADKTVTTV